MVKKQFLNVRQPRFNRIESLTERSFQIVDALALKPGSNREDRERDLEERLLPPLHEPIIRESGLYSFTQAAGLLSR